MPLTRAFKRLAWPWPFSGSDDDHAAPRPTATMPRAARLVMHGLTRLSHGHLSVVWPDGHHTQHGQPHVGSALHAHVHLHDWQVCTDVLRSGDIGLAEAYAQQRWSTPDLTAFLRVCAANREAIEKLVYGTWWGSLVYRVKHWQNRNHKANSRKNIHAHYDLGNEFYRRWLDPSMNYSSAWFERSDMSLNEAQTAKMRRALDMAGVTEGSRVLEIGCGWGAIAEMATAELGADYVGVTLSPAQLGYAQLRLAEQPTAALRADLRLQDYRDIGVAQPEAPFDAICSIEMFEAVGQAYWPSYFETVARLLKPQGKACIQTIVIRDDLLGRYLKGTDFIQQYIFPGGCLPSVSAFKAQAERVGLQVVDTFAIGKDYARTLRHWRDAYFAHKPELTAMGFDERFHRIWHFYLAYCEAGFEEGSIDVVQFTLQAPEARP